MKEIKNIELIEVVFIALTIISFFALMFLAFSSVNYMIDADVYGLIRCTAGLISFTIVLLLCIYFFITRDDEKNTCGDCGVKEGCCHLPGCDCEICPFCGGQLISCECCYEKLGLKDLKKNGSKYDGLTKEVYYNGLNEEQANKWEQILIKKGFIPYVEIPVLCAVCGAVYPDFFIASDRDWKKYIIPELRDKVLCRGCYDHMKKLFPNGIRGAE